MNDSLFRRVTPMCDTYFFLLMGLSLINKEKHQNRPHVSSSWVELTLWLFDVLC